MMGQVPSVEAAASGICSEPRGGFGPLDNDGREIGVYSTPDDGAKALLEFALTEAV